MDVKKEIADNDDAHKFSSTTVYVKKEITEFDIHARNFRSTVVAMNIKKEMTDNDDVYQSTSTTAYLNVKKEIADNDDVCQSTSTTAYMNVKKEIMEFDDEIENKTSLQVLSKRQRKRQKWKALQKAKQNEKRGINIQQTESTGQNISHSRKFLKSLKIGNSLSKDVKKEIMEFDDKMENKTGKQVLSRRERKRLVKQRNWKALRKTKQNKKSEIKIKKAESTGKNLGHSRKFLKSLKIGNSPSEFKLCFDLISNNENESMAHALYKRQHKLFAQRQKWLDSKILKIAKMKMRKKMKKQNSKTMEQNQSHNEKSLKSIAKFPCKLKICFDLSLADVMAGAQFLRTFRLLHNCYSINQKASKPLQLYITGYTDNTLKSMSKMPEGFDWDVNFSQESYCDIFDKSKIIYLTSDSPNVLEELDYDKVYIIGALINHGGLKNICYEKAVKEGVNHAKLPLDMYVNIKSRRNLRIDHVYSILLHLTKGNTWVDAIIRGTWPQRKDIKVKDLTSMKQEVDEKIISMKHEVDESKTGDICLETGLDSSDSCGYD